jgi:cytosine deaminase
MLFDSNHYWLRNAHVPLSLMVGGSKWTPRKPPTDHLLCVDLEIQDGKIATLTAAGTFTSSSVPSIDLEKGIVLSCFSELHTHLDKGHVWERSPNPDGSFDAALLAMSRDSRKYWNAEDVYRRMEFGLKCSYAHGTKAIRTHIDSFGKQANISWNVFDELRSKWADRIKLQAVALVTLDYYMTPAGDKLADLVAEMGGILGGVAFTNPDLEDQIERVFQLAKARKLHLDFHVDENNEVDSICLKLIAEATIRHKYKGKVVCGHCCSLSVQPEDEVQETIALVKKAGIAVVSLPMCNLYLQDRNFMS